MGKASLGEFPAGLFSKLPVELVAAALLLGAHFLRAGNVVAAALCLVTPLLFLHRQRWILLPLQVMAYGASASWVITLL